MDTVTTWVGLGLGAAALVPAWKGQGRPRMAAVIGWVVILGMASVLAVASPATRLDSNSTDLSFRIALLLGDGSERSVGDVHNAVRLRIANGPSHDDVERALDELVASGLIAANRAIATLNGASVEVVTYRANR